MTTVKLHERITGVAGQHLYDHVAANRMAN